MKEVYEHESIRLKTLGVFSARTNDINKILVLGKEAARHCPMKESSVSSFSATKK